MTLRTIMNNGYKLRAWAIKKSRGEIRIAVKLSKITSRGERFYVAHSPQIDKILSDVEFTAPILLKEVK